MLFRSVEQFCFDTSVVAVFQDMIRRSVPGYGMVLSLVAVLGEAYLQPNTRAYDLGSSLGASSLALSTVAAERNCSIIAIDNAKAMVAQCKKNLSDIQPRCSIELVEQDIKDTEVTGASMVMMNFTLQFISVDCRFSVLSRIYEGLLPGGILMLSEKVLGETKESDSCLCDLHHGFKRANGYSQLEISKKRSALEGVMITETVSAHTDRLLKIGFTRVEVIFQALNFVSMVAFK